MSQENKKYFIKLDGIDGESTTKGHEKWIVVSEFNMSNFQEINKGTSRMTAGGNSFSPFTFGHDYDRASPNLFKFCASGKGIKEAKFVCLKSVGDDNPEVYLTVTMTDVFVASVSTSSSSGTASVYETVSLSYSTVKIEYQEQTDKNTLAAAVSGGWDVVNDKANT